MIPHFILQKGKQEHLIIRMGDEFHIIDCNEALTKEKRNAVLESGCTPAQMQEMGLSGMTIPKSDIKALTVTGCGYQDDVIFYLHKKTLAFWFPKAYEQRKVDDFFRGIPRKMVKTRRRMKGGKGLDWRAREQNPAKLPMFKRIGTAWNVLSGLTIAGMLFTGREMFAVWFWVVLALLILAVYLNCTHGLYFAFYWYKGDDHDRGKGKASHLGYGIMLLILVACLRSPYVILDFGKLVAPGLILSAVIWIALYVFIRECREDVIGWALTAFLVIAFCGSMVIPHTNHILGPEPQVQTAQVVSKSTSRGSKGGRHYNIAVRLPDGRECSFSVSAAEYDTIEAGDLRKVRVGTGFFDIDYAIDV